MDYTFFDLKDNFSAPGGTVEELAERLNRILKEKRMFISASESFTAGRISSAIVSVPGASAVFHEGIVSYSNASKEKRLGVKKRTLKNFGAVSAECCAEMASGLIASGGCDIAISSTGIAGPSNDGTDKPVGLCYLGIATRSYVKIYGYKLNGTREEITETAVRLALSNAVSEIE
ncbi:MAG: CinA family protein [Clostridia bacterium]|nr:CinA family protein [Clostridia bacterium]